MKVFKAIVAILIFLLLVFAGIYWLLRNYEVKRWEKFKNQYYSVLDTGRAPDGERIVWNGKVIEMFPEERLLLIQAYQLKKPTEFKFYVSNSGTYALQTKVGDWLEVRGDVKEFWDGIPVLSTIYFDNWLYFYFDIGLFKDPPDRLEKR